MINEAAILLLFAALNIAALFYRQSFSRAATVYLASLVLLYAVSLFWEQLKHTSYCAVLRYLSLYGVQGKTLDHSVFCHGEHISLWGGYFRDRWE